MLTKIIVDAYSMLIEISLWLLLFIGFFGGWYAGGFLGAVAGLIIAFVFGAMFFGAFMILGDIRNLVRSIENKKQV